MWMKIKQINKNMNQSFMLSCWQQNFFLGCLQKLSISDKKLFAIPNQPKNVWNLHKDNFYLPTPDISGILAVYRSLVNFGSLSLISWILMINSDSGSTCLPDFLSIALARSTYRDFSSLSNFFAAWISPVFSSIMNRLPAPSPVNMYFKFPSPLSWSVCSFREVEKKNSINICIVITDQIIQHIWISLYNLDCNWGQQWLSSVSLLKKLQICDSVIHKKIFLNKSVKTWGNIDDDVVMFKIKT